jgi:hypothetical protein
MLIDSRSVQRFLQSKGLYQGEIDGDFGFRSHEGARIFLAGLGPDISTYQPGWPDRRVRIAIEQSMMREIGADLGKIDGIAGVRTQIALEKWQDHITFNKPPLPEAPVHQPPVWPRQRDVAAFFGQPGQNQVKLQSPYPLFLDWDLSEKITGFMIHEKCHDSALRVMKRVLQHYGQDQIHALGLDQFGGCLNVRKMRNGSAWSMHAWGIAIDWDADRNKLRETSRTARMARPEYKVFLDLWEAEGWISLGRERNFDWMHVQAARL